MEMTFARIVFWIAGVTGLLEIGPLYVLEARIGQSYPPALNHVEFYYGFAATAIAWQLVFLLVGSGPARFRPVMLVAMVEKFGFAGAVLALAWQNRIPSPFVLAGIMDLAFGAAFAIAWWKTGRRAAA